MQIFSRSACSNISVPLSTATMFYAEKKRRDRSKDYHKEPSPHAYEFDLKTLSTLRLRRQLDTWKSYYRMPNYKSIYFIHVLRAEPADLYVQIRDLFPKPLLSRRVLRCSSFRRGNLPTGNLLPTAMVVASAIHLRSSCES